MAEKETRSGATPEQQGATPEQQHEVQGTDPALSRQAHFSTYSPAPAPTDAEGNPINPPPGPFVHQELGNPTEAVVTPPEGAQAKPAK
jgi:hypothetical protein